MSSLLEADRACEALAATHYENFPVLSALMPRAQRPHIARLYAYCRHVDDLGDEGPLGRQERLAALEAWRADLARCWSGEHSPPGSGVAPDGPEESEHAGHGPYARDLIGKPEHPILRALAATVAELGLPAGPFERLVDANVQDQQVSRYATFEDLRAYCRCSADPVGELVLAIFGSRDAELLALSDRICTGLQLANFWQDVAVDRDKGRLYLPLEDLDRFGVASDRLEADPEAFRRLMAFEVERAREWLHSGAPLAGQAPKGLGGPVGLFVRGGLAILSAIEASRYDVLARRPKVGRMAKLGILVATVGARATGRW